MSCMVILLADYWQPPIMSSDPFQTSYTCVALYSNPANCARTVASNKRAMGPLIAQLSKRIKSHLKVTIRTYLIEWNRQNVRHLLKVKEWPWPLPLKCPITHSEACILKKSPKFSTIPSTRMLKHFPIDMNQKANLTMPLKNVKVNLWSS